jgi:hypothetical protein
MPFLKPIDKFEPLWKDWDRRAQKHGLHATVYSTNKDEYIGEWLNNKRHGKGVYNYIKKGQIYEGEWFNNARHGFGNLSIKNKDNIYKKVYSGGWKDDKKHVRMLFKISNNFKILILIFMKTSKRATAHITIQTMNTLKVNGIVVNGVDGVVNTIQMATFMKVNG